MDSVNNYLRDLTNLVAGEYARNYRGTMNLSDGSERAITQVESDVTIEQIASNSLNHLP